MDTTKIPAIEARFTPVTRVDLRLHGAPDSAAYVHPSEASASAETPEPEAAEPSAPAPNHMLVKIDVEAGRFVNTLLDGNSEEVIRQYPSDAQLAYSKAIRAYLRALSGD